MTVEDRLQDIDEGVLTPLVRRVLRSDGVVVRTWDVKPLAGGLGVAVGAGVLSRVAGTAHERGVELIEADDALLASEEPVTGDTFDAVLDRFAAVQPFVLDLADEARDLLAAV